MEFLNFVAKKENEMGRQIKDLDELDQIQIDYKKRKRQDSEI